MKGSQQEISFNAQDRILLIGSDAHLMVRFRGHLISELKKRGLTVHVVAPNIDTAIAATFHDLGVVAHDIPLINDSLNPLRALRSRARLKRLLREISPEFILAYTIQPIILGAWAAKAARSSKITAMITGLGYPFTHGPGWHRAMSRKLAIWGYRFALKQASLVVFQNRDDRETFQMGGLIPATVSVRVADGSGVDLQHFYPTPLPSPPSFLMIGRLRGDKGVREYGEAALKLKQKFPNARVALAGALSSAPDRLTRDELRAFVAGGIEYLGHVADIRGPISRSSVVVLPSYREGLPRSLLEALSMGRAIISTDVPGCRETLVHGVNGLLVPDRDATALLQAMESMLAHPRMVSDMGRASRGFAVARYDVHRINEELLRHIGI